MTHYRTFRTPSGSAGGPEVVCSTFEHAARPRAADGAISCQEDAESEPRLANISERRMRWNLPVIAPDGSTDRPSPRLVDYRRFAFTSTMHVSETIPHCADHEDDCGGRGKVDKMFRFLAGSRSSIKASSSKMKRPASLYELYDGRAKVMTHPYEQAQLPEWGHDASAAWIAVKDGYTYLLLLTIPQA